MLMTAPIRRTTVESALGSQDSRLGDLEAVPIFAQYEIKVSSDDTDGDALSTTDTFYFCIPRDLDGAVILDAQAFVSVAGGSIITVQVRNSTTSANMLFDPITIDAGEFTSFTAATPAEIFNNDEVSVGDLIQIVVVDAGGGSAYGLGVILKFSVTFPGA